MKQQNRVQLSFYSIVKIFGVYGIALELFFILFYAINRLAGFKLVNIEPSEFFLTLFFLPFIAMIFAVIGYPFYALINRLRGGGLLLTVVKFKRPNGAQNDN